MSEQIQVVVFKKCEYCDGTGGYMRQPGPLTYDINDVLNQDHKDTVPNVEKIQKQLDSIPKEVPGFTDKKVFIICRFCNGNGQNKRSINLTDLKDLINK